MVTELQINAQEILNRFMLAASLGYQYNGDRDVYTALGYPKSITFADYYTRYKRQDIAKAIINRPVAATWKGVVAIADQNEKTDKLKEAYEKLDKQLQLKAQFVRADKLASLGRFGCLLLGFGDVQNEQDLTNPVTGNKLKLLYVTPLAESSAKVQTWVEDPTDKRYGHPLIYKVTIETAEKKSKVISVHYSRMIHIAGEQLENEIYGTPALEPVWNRLMDLEKLVGGSAEMYWRGARPGYAGKVDKDMAVDPDLKTRTEEQMKEYEHGMRRFLVAQGIDFNALAQQIADPSNHVDIQIQMISSITGIPKRILVGSERGELSSGQDRDQWDTMITSRREEFAEQQIIKPFVDRMMRYGALPQSETYSVLWESLFVVSDKDKAEVGRIRATALKEYAQSPEAQQIMPPEMFYKLFLGLTDEQMDEVWTILEMVKQEEPEETIE
jgi:hypothetical protein